jgi:uncharacterized damage-inducible protein DinB
MMRRIAKPRAGEYPPYAEMYLRLLPDDGRVLEHLEAGFRLAMDLVASLPEERLLFRYAPGKWSIKDVLVHIVDDERIYAYRALRFARNEQQGLIGFDQDAYVRFAEADTRSLTSIMDEYSAVRQATITLFEHLPEAAFDRMGHGTGTANDATVRALAWHIAGHERHHLEVISTRYLS